MDNHFGTRSVQNALILNEGAQQDAKPENKKKTECISLVRQSWRQSDRWALKDCAIMMPFQQLILISLRPKKCVRAE
jgi:hypothetical protein